MSLYAEYLKERTGDQIIEVDEGFASYRYLDNGKTVYIVDIYVDPKCRKYGHAAAMANAVAEIAKKHGCTHMIGTVQVSLKGSTTSLKVLLAYGMTLHSISGDAIIMRKEI